MSSVPVLTCYYPGCRLAGVVHQLLFVTLSPNVPVSLRNIPIKYNLVSRLWVHAFHRLLEYLRQQASSSASPEIALENLVVSALLQLPYIEFIWRLGIHLLRLHLLCGPHGRAELVPVSQ